MTHIQSLLAQPACRALGWALLHFLWQGTLAALALAACNFALRDSPARVRYAVSCLFLMVLLGAANWNNVEIASLLTCEREPDTQDPSIHNLMNWFRI